MNAVEILAPMFDSNGLIPVIAQQHDSGEVLMLAWMNRVSLALSIELQHAVYWSRSRKKLWKKGETSGHLQKIIDIRIDCDNDAILLLVDQTGPACHTFRPSCFYKSLKDGELRELTSPIR
jgi:phosphoribosyl-AMP cyclohydrolase